MTIEEMRARKRELGYSNKELARRSGVPLGTLQKIFSGATCAPRREAVEALERALRPQPASSPHAVSPYALPYMAASEAEKTDTALPGMLREPMPAYHISKPEDEFQSEKRQGEFTLEDYYALPDDRRAELIDGVFYDLSSPGNLHQAISVQIAHQLERYVSDSHGDCMIYTAPFDVQLDKDNRTMVQPDLVIICHRDRLKRFGCFGAPDLVMEILSPATAKKDLLVKLQKYIRAGVREYWIIHPDTKQVTVYRNEGALQLMSYSFKDKIPVGIWKDRFSVDFARIYDRISFLYELED